MNLNALWILMPVAKLDFLCVLSIRRKAVDGRSNAERFQYDGTSNLDVWHF